MQNRCFRSAQSSFDEALNLFKIAHTEDPKTVQLLDDLNPTRLEDVEKAVLDAKTRYENKKRSKVARQLFAFAQRVQYYGKIMDVLVQQHPEYVSLAWGAMKLLFVVGGDEIP